MNMKRIIFIFAMLISFGAFSQKIQWGQEYKADDKTSIYDYIGNIEDNNYFAFGYKTTGFLRRFNRIGFMKVNSNNVKSYTDEYIEIPLFSLIGSFTTVNNIAVLYQKENKDNDANEVRCKIIDKNTLTENSEKVLLSFNTQRKDDASINVFHSKDKSKIAVSYYNYNRKSEESYLVFTVFDNTLDKLWANQYTTKQEGMVSILDVETTNEGDIYVLSKVKGEKTKIILTKINGDELDEKVVSNDLDFNNARLYVINNNTVFIADNSKGKFTGITYNLGNSEITNTVSFEYLKDKGTYWGIKDIYKLENGNLVTVVEDSYLHIEESTTAPATYTYYNRNFYSICVNPNEGKIVYNQLLSKATRYFNRYKTGCGQFESPLYFTVGNDFYAIYNTDKDDNDLAGQLFIETNITFPKGRKSVVTNILKINEQGKPTQITLFGKKETDAMFSANISFEAEKGKIILGRFIDKENINFGTMQFNE